jgi:hypothetical protein
MKNVLAAFVGVERWCRKSEKQGSVPLLLLCDESLITAIGNSEVSQEMIDKGQ